MNEGIRSFRLAVGFSTFMLGFTTRGCLEQDYQDVLRTNLQNNVTLTAEDVNKDGVDDLVLRIGEQEHVYVKSSEDGVYRPVQKVLEAKKQEEQSELDKRIEEARKSYSLKRAKAPYNPD